MKLCIIYNFAAHYRSGIFQLIDQSYDCNWYFGKKNADIKKMDYSLLKGTIKELKTIKVLGLSYQIGAVSLLRNNYDNYILLSDTHCLSSWLFLLCSKLFHKKKIFIWTHGFYGKETKFQNIFKKFLYKLPNGGIFLYGNYARNLMIKEGFNKNKLFVIHNSLLYNMHVIIRERLKKKPLYSEHFVNSNFNLIFVGRITHVKKIDMVLKVIAELKTLGHNYNFTMIGEGEMLSELKLLSEKLGISDSVWFFGSCYDEKLLGEMIYNADLCVSPGNVGLTAIHSMTFGTPVLTHNNFSSQMPEFEAVIPLKTGQFFEYNKEESLAEKIDEWFRLVGSDREFIRKQCYQEIDTNWTPSFQLMVLQKYIQ